MNAQNYLKINIGKLYRYDKEPKFFTKEMAVTLMEGYAKHKTNEFPYTYMDFINLLTKLNQSKEAIKELELELEKKKDETTWYYEAMKERQADARRYYDWFEEEAEKVKKLEAKIEMLTDGMDTICHLFKEVENEVIRELRKEIAELRGQLNYEQNKTH